MHGVHKVKKSETRHGNIMNWTHTINVRIAKEQYLTYLTYKIRFTIKHILLTECRQH